MISLYISPSLTPAEALEDVMNLSFSCSPNTTPHKKAARNVKYSNQNDQVDVDLERKNLDYPLLSNV